MGLCEPCKTELTRKPMLCSACTDLLELYGTDLEPILCKRCNRMLQQCTCENPCKPRQHNRNCACTSLVA